MWFNDKKKQAIKPGKDTEEMSVHIGKGKKPEASLKRLPTVWFQIYGMLEEAQLQIQEKDEWLLKRLGEKVKHK